MLAIEVLALSIVLQFVAAGLALRLVRVTGWRLAWGTISAALLLMAIRRCVTLYSALFGSPAANPELPAELVALTVSAFLVVGVWLVGSLRIRAREGEERLRISEARLADAQRIGKMGNWDWDIEADTIRWSDQISRIFGVQRGEFGGTSESFFKYVHPDDRESVQAAAAAALEGGTTLSIDHRIVLADETIRFVHEQAEVTCDDIGAPISMQGTVQDRTERAEAQRLLADSEDELRQAQKMKAVGQLTGGIAHDFNNILAIIMGNLELLAESSRSDEAMSRRVDTALAASARGSDLTHRLLDFSRKQGSEPTAVDVADAIEGAAELMGATLGEDIEIATLCGDDVWDILVEPSQFENALLNLAVNARDAMPDGGSLGIEAANIRIDDHSAKGLHDAVPGDFVVISVSDTGCGMTRETIDKVFEPFFTTKDVGKGTGLGLSTVYGFVRQSEGTISLESEPGAGTVVKLYLPKVSSSLIRMRDDGTKEYAVPLGDETVLVVEDDPDLREIVCTTLSSLGYRVLEAGHGPEAIELFGENPEIDLLLSDLTLPKGMNGLEIAEKIRQGLPGLKVLFMSGNPKAVFGNDQATYEGVELMLKPFRRADLAQRVREILDETELHRAAGE